MNRHLALWSILAIVLASSSPSQAVIYGPTGDGGTFNAYQYVTNDRNWDAARRDAELRTFLSTPGHLVSIKNAAENVFANNVGFNNERWLGLTDATGISTIDGYNPAVALGTVEGGNTSGGPANTPGQLPIAGQRGFGWRWVDGTPATFHAWNGGEPNNSGEEDAAHYTGTAGLWNDNKAGTSIGNGADSNRDALVEYNTNVALNDLRAFQARIMKVQDVQIPGITVGSLAEAKQVLAGTRGPLEGSFNGGVPLTQTRATINMADNTTPGFFPGTDTNYPGFTGAQDNFVIFATGNFTASSGGQYTFGVNSDDGFGLLIRDANTNAIVNFQDFSGQGGTGIVTGELQFAAGRGHSNDPLANAVASYGRINLTAGTQYKFELTHWEGGGGVATIETYWMLGSPTDYVANAAGPALSFSDGTYTLLGTLGDLNPTGLFNVTTHKLRNQVNFPDITTIAQADQALAGTFGAPTAAGFPLNTHYSVININNSGSGNPTADLGAFNTANGNPDDPVFGIGGNSDDFVIQAKGFIFVENAGIHTFGIRSDDGARLRIDINGDGLFTDADNLINGNGVLNFVYANALLNHGWYPIELTYFERGGGADLELFSAFNPLGVLPANGQNPLTGATGGLAFRLVGDTDRGGLLVSAIVVPEPGTLGLLGLSALALLRRRRAA